MRHNVRERSDVNKCQSKKSAQKRGQYDKSSFFDVDGTLVSHAKNEVPGSARAAINKLKEKNIKCVVATGRHMLELMMLPVRDIDFDGYITLNGQLCLDDKRSVIYGTPISGKDKEQIIRLFEEQKIPIVLVEKDAMYINFVNRQVKQAQKDVSTEIPALGTYTGNEIYQAVAFVQKEDGDLLKEDLPGCKITRWNDRAVDIISRHGGKMSGIQQYLGQCNISREETMSFGDGENDIEMLEFTEVGIAMGNADEAVKKCADYVTSGVDEDGIEKALKYYEMIE